MTTAAYGASTVKRNRRTNAELAELDAAITDVLIDEHPATVRGVFYRVVSAGLVPKTDSGYQVIQRELLKLRRAKVVPYNWIVDGTRWIRKPASYDSVEAALEEAAASFRRSLWRTQDHEKMVFVEKDAISGVIYPVTAKWDVALGVMRGMASETFCHDMADEIAYVLARDKYVMVYQLGDHDPSGVNIWNSFKKKVIAFVDNQVEHHIDWLPDTFVRLAVTPEQIDDLELVGHETKHNKTEKSKAAAAAFGDSYEVDAIPPHMLREIVETAILDGVDNHAMAIEQIAEESGRTILTRMAETFAGGHEDDS